MVSNLGMSTKHDFVNASYISHNPTENAIYKFQNHPSVISIKKHMKGVNFSFSFQTITKENSAKIITK